MPIFRNEKKVIQSNNLTNSEAAAGEQFERSVSDLVQKVKEGPYSDGLKLQLFDTLLEFLDEKLDEHREQSRSSRADQENESVSEKNENVVE